MPKIKLKQKSPLFIDDITIVDIHECDMPDCLHKAEHRAPKDRDLKDYYNFCYDHVSAYNRAWNYFDGMKERDIEDYINNGSIWDRPTWQFASDGAADEILRKKAWQSYHFTDKEPPKGDHQRKRFDKEENARRAQSISNTPENQALTELGLLPPVTLDQIKVTYKQLVKKYHPDLNNNCPMAEEKSKNINAAYTVLRLAYQKYEKLEEKFKG